MSKERHAALRKLHPDLPDGPRKKVGQFLESHFFEMLVLSLVLCDVVLVATDGSIDHHWLCIKGVDVPAKDGLPDLSAPFHEEVLSRVIVANSFLQRKEAAHDVTPVRPPVLVQLGLRLLAAQGRESEVAHGARAANSGRGGASGGGGGEHESGWLVCEDRDGHLASHIRHVCHHLSIAILCFFMVELSLKVWVNPQGFFEHPLYVLDLVVVTISLIVDTVVISLIERHKEDPNLESKKELAEVVVMLLTACRIWRIVRIVHALFEVGYEEYDRQQEKSEEMLDLQKDALKMREVLMQNGFEREAMAIPSAQTDA